MLRDSSRHPAPSLERDAGGSYTRKEVCRLLKIDGRQLRGWERQELVPVRTEYRFSDLLALKRLAVLRAQQAHPRAIRQAMIAIQTKLGDVDSSANVRVYKEGRRVHVQIGKQKMEPLSGQLLFDFAEVEISKILQLPPSEKKSASAMAQRFRDKLEADRWFDRGLELEQTGAPIEQIIEAYKNAAELDPTAAGALVNLGTVYFNGHAWADAEKQYLRALEIDPYYALAHFNLGNLYDERGDSSSALHHYQEALRLNPQYADAHYNLALLHQNLKDVMGAVRHWRAYLKLDGGSAWAHIARRELGKLESSLRIVKGGRPAASHQ